MNQETLKSTGEMRRKGCLLDSPARRTGSDGDGCLRQEDCVGVAVTTCLAAEARRQVRQGEVASVLRATPCEGTGGSLREGKMRAVLTTEQGGAREGRHSGSSPEKPSPQFMTFAYCSPLGSRVA
jgi:hypothetical protein